MKNFMRPFQANNFVCFLVVGIVTFSMVSVAEATAITTYNQAPYCNVSQSSTLGVFNGAENAVDDDIYSLSSTLEEEHPWWQADLGGVFGINSIYLFNPLGITPVTLTFQDTATNSSYTKSLDPTETYSYAYTFYLPPAIYADLVTVELQQSGSLQLGTCEIDVYSAAPVPEPATILLFGTGLTGLVGSRIRRKKKAASV